ncbi:11559_t:CDS:2, partial [Dentiscutata heterogama]
KKLTKSELNTCDQIRERLLISRNVIKINYDELKSEYLNTSDKKNFLTQFREKWLRFKSKIVAIKQSCDIDDVLHKRAEFLLLGNYLVSTADNNISILKNYNKVVYKRFSILNDIIGDEILLLPFHISFYTKNRNVSKVKSLIKWFKNGKGEDLSKKKIQCSFCNELINLRPQIQQYLASESFIDQFEICHIHTSESHVVLNGKEKNYPLTIDFDNLSKRIKKLFSELLKIVTKQTQSLYRDQVINVFKNYKNNPKKPSF